MHKWLMLLLGCVISGTLWAQVPLHHQLQVTLNPDKQQLEVVDELQLTPGQVKTIYLHAGLDVQASKGSIKRVNQLKEDFAVPVNVYEVEPDTDGLLRLHYQGNIHQPLPAWGGDSPAFVSREGVYLGASSAWYPMTDQQLLTFEMKVTLPERWRAVSQGGRSGQQEEGEQWKVTWSEKSPQQEIFLIAAQFYQFSRKADAIQVMAFLRDKDPSLAERYMTITADYIRMYEQLIGLYPYAKFALVENFWSTGYGMPSFTLLGSDIIRLPFIPYTSYPHEILHNWWGNSVYVDYASGNWSEGLTSYLADHLLKEMRGDAVGFRRNILQGYADFVDMEKDFALTEFRSRHSDSSQAIGYGKTQMLFHMLRLMLGDEVFKQGLQKLYAEQKFKVTSYADLIRSFSTVSGHDLAPFFQQWIERVGAPQLKLSKVRTIEVDDRWQLYATLDQMQDGPAYELNIPLAVTLENKVAANQTIFRMDKKQQQLVYSFDQKPLRIDIDPEFDLFRRADVAEIPAALSLAYGAKEALMVLPFSAKKEEVREYHNLITQWRMRLPVPMKTVYDNEIDELPTDKTVWLLGWDNKFIDQLNPGLEPYGVEVDDDEVTFGELEWDSEQHSVVLVQRQPDNPKQALVWLAAHKPEAIAGLARKLPHYRKYSYLMFEGDAPDNKRKGQWEIKSSPMSFSFDNEVSMGQLAPRPALVK